MISEMIDPRLECLYVAQEVECMMHAASLCIATNPKKRPRMSKVHTNFLPLNCSVVIAASLTFSLMSCHEQSNEGAADVGRRYS